MSDVGELAGGAPAADDAVCGAGADGKGGVGAAAEDIVPDETEVEDIEDEAAEESVLGIGDKVEDLTGRSCEQGRLGLFHIDLLLAGGIVLGEAVLVVHRLGLIDLTQPFVDGFDDVTSEGEAAFAGRGFCCDEEEQVRIDRAVGVDAPNVREAGGDDGHRAEGEDVGILRYSLVLM